MGAVIVMTSLRAHAQGCTQLCIFLPTFWWLCGKLCPISSAHMILAFGVVAIITLDDVADAAAQGDICCRACILILRALQLVELRMPGAGPVWRAARGH